QARRCRLVGPAIAGISAVPLPPAVPLAEVPAKVRPALLRKLLGVDAAGEISEARLEFGNAHPGRLEVHVEQSAQIPRFLTEDAPLILQTGIQRRARKRSLH